MKIKVKLHPNSSQEKIEEIKKNEEYEVWIKEKPIDGKANDELAKVLKRYFDKRVEIIQGFKSRNKTVKLLD